jgi:hypothetical protein
MKVAALQAPLPSVGTAAGLALIRRRVDQCEAEGVTVLGTRRGARRYIA